MMQALSADLPCLNVCIIDNDIPNLDEDTLRRLDQLSLQRRVEETVEWTDTELKRLVEALLEDPARWNVYGYVHPEFYLRDTRQSLYQPADVVVFDWDYPAGGDPVDALLEVLERTYSLVWVYSGVDHESEILEHLEDSRFSAYKDRGRLTVLPKLEESAEKLARTAQETYHSRFAFRFGKSIRQAAANAVERVLVEFGKHSDNFVRDLIAEDEQDESPTVAREVLISQLASRLEEDPALRAYLDEECHFQAHEVREILLLCGGRVREAFEALDVDFASQGAVASNSGKPEELWKCRMYFKPSDEIVRRCDIMQNVKTGQHALVLTPDCDLARVWGKTFGHVALVPLYDVRTQANDILRIASLSSKENLVDRLKDLKLGSLTGAKIDKWPGVFLLPFVPSGESSSYYLGFPGHISSECIGKGTKEEKTLVYASYDVWTDWKRICSLAEPFSSALAQHCLASIAGYGAPSYPRVVKNLIGLSVKELFEEATTAQEDLGLE